MKNDTTNMETKTSSQEGRRGNSPSQSTDEEIKHTNKWRADLLARLRDLILAVDPEIVEEVKWRKPSNPAGVPVWSRSGIICTGETYKDKVKLTFAMGAALADPAGLFNASLEGNTRRAIDLHEDDKINEEAFKALIRAAVALNISNQKTIRPTRSRKTPKNG